MATSDLSLRNVLLGIAILLFALAGIGVNFNANVSFVAIGLAFFAAGVLVGDR